LCHESGIHTSLLLKNRETYQIIKASQIGLIEKEFIFGKHSGKKALIEFLEIHKVRLPGNNYDQFLDIMKAYAYKQKRSLSGKEVLSLAKK
jgi:isopropylmalate/homocitrate/citramalate synthase